MRIKIYFTRLGNDKVQKGLIEALNRYRKQEELRKSRFFARKSDSERILSGLSRQLSKT